MLVSEARQTANRQNALKSTGPRTSEGKARSRQNGLKHGLSGAGVVVDSEAAREVELRASALFDEFRPQSPLGQILVQRMAFLSVRMERSAGQELANLASRARHAIDDHDEARHDEAERLFDELNEAPRRNLRKLKKSPEGIERLLDAWLELRDDLTRGPKPVWTAAHLETAANLDGIRGVAALSSHLGALSRGVWGDFDGLTDLEGGDLDDSDRQLWAKGRLVERIDTEIAALEAHFDTLDHDGFDLDRLEAPARSQFDPSREATLARRYEAEAQRGFFKALNELRQADAEPTNPTRPSGPARPEEPLASSRAGRPPAVRDPIPTDPTPLPDRKNAALSPEMNLPSGDRGVSKRETRQIE